jgi:hypothetical protein
LRDSILSARNRGEADHQAPDEYTETIGRIITSAEHRRGSA